VSASIGAVTEPSILDELEELSKQATPMPWDAVISTGCVRYLGKPIEPLEHGDYVANCRGLDAASANLYLIAAMRSALPELLKIARAVADNSPWVPMNDDEGRILCWACSANRTTRQHAADCVYAVACKFAGVAP
jgi:hypothetical protein